MRIHRCPVNSEMPSPICRCFPRKIFQGSRNWGASPAPRQGSGALKSLPGGREVVDHSFLGERAEHEYPLGSFFRAGVVVISSSDHAVTPVPNPLWAIRAGVTRNLNNAVGHGVKDITDMDDPTWLLDKNERASLDEMIRSYTINSAYAHFLESETGSIEVGKSADLVIIAKDLTKLNPIEFNSVKILKTIFQGEVVFEVEEQN